ncbi:AprI/Inh family metalloprotease inhibitor [Rhizobium ruizarguesonis]
MVDATVGEWLIVSEDGSLGCHVMLGKEKTNGGREVTEGKVCGAPWQDQIAAWDFASPGIVLRDATRKEIIGFGEREVGPWVTDIERSPRIYFVPQPGKIDRAATEKGAVGKWVLTDKK